MILASFRPAGMCDLCLCGTEYFLKLALDHTYQISANIKTLIGFALPLQVSKHLLSVKWRKTAAPSCCDNNFRNGEGSVPQTNFTGFN